MERKLLYRLRFGSHLYGLQTPESDIDYISIVMPLPEDLLGLQKLEEIDNSTKSSADERRNTNEDIDDKTYTLHRFIHLLIQGNPSLTECLFSKEPEFEHPIITELKGIKEYLISERVKHSFLGFAFAQKKKLLVKASRYFSLEKCLDYLNKNFSEHLESTVYELTEEELDFLNRTLEDI